MGIVVWIVFGVVVGWLGSKVAGGPQRGCLTNIVIGIGGAMFGGSVLALATGRDLLFPSDAPDFLLTFVASVLGAAALFLGLRALGRRA